MKIHASLDDDEVWGGGVLWGGMSWWHLSVIEMSIILPVHSPACLSVSYPTLRPTSVHPSQPVPGVSMLHLTHNEGYAYDVSGFLHVWQHAFCDVFAHEGGLLWRCHFSCKQRTAGCSGPAVCEISRATHMHKISSTDRLNSQGCVKTLSCSSQPETHFCRKATVIWSFCRKKKKKKRKEKKKKAEAAAWMGTAPRQPHLRCPIQQTHDSTCHS